MLKWLLENVPILNQHDVLNLVAKVSKKTPMYEIVDDSHSCVCICDKYRKFTLSMRKSS